MSVVHRSKCSKYLQHAKVTVIPRNMSNVCAKAEVFIQDMDTPTIPPNVCVTKVKFGHLEYMLLYSRNIDILHIKKGKRFDFCIIFRCR